MPEAGGGWGVGYNSQGVTVELQEKMPAWLKRGRFSGQRLVGMHGVYDCVGL